LLFYRPAVMRAEGKNTGAFKTEIEMDDVSIHLTLNNRFLFGFIFGCLKRNILPLEPSFKFTFLSIYYSLYLHNDNSNWKNDNS